MIISSPYDWLGALAILLFGIPVVALYYRYGGQHLRHPVRLHQLCRRVGAEFPKLPVPRRNIATFTCNNCNQTEICRVWLQHGTETVGYRSFCPNANVVDWLTGSPMDAELRLDSVSANKTSPGSPPVAG